MQPSGYKEDAESRARHADDVEIGGANMTHDSCNGCCYDLGGGRDNCRINLSGECRDGGGFEAYEPIEDDVQKED